MPKSPDQIAADQDRARVLALGEGRLVNGTDRGYFIDSLKRQFPAAVKYVITLSKVVDEKAQEDGAWVSPAEAEAIATMLREDPEADIVRLLLEHRAAPENETEGLPQVEIQYI